ncbi:STAS/SEC14 domain-containing protein [Hymenobacter jeollabukensis]|uniref:STAS/SEC14 domain-containing protein n=1 Tax=Hymenobacter jeollabukensis TaxID=2025313 RepID=A0A5R8WL05_9BACT|nr:STAS/SEC14 domain-containing protein [Hymenobacter jeollabukensis]TLM89524.1 STAS/SEC14 domain-containing protein [Hymenobacter jeollabukensis]
MPLSNPLPHACKIHSPAELVYHVDDDHGQRVADFGFFATERVLYVRWHGHLTADEVIRVAEASLPWHEQLHPVGLLNDKRGTSGEWGESMAWIEYEWIPRAKASGLQAFAYVINPDMMVSFENAALIEKIRQKVDLRTFYSVGAAWKWLRQHAFRRTGAAA